MNQPLDSADLQHLINKIDLEIWDLEDRLKNSYMTPELRGEVRGEYFYWMALHDKLCAMQTEALEREGLK